MTRMSLADFRSLPQHVVRKPGKYSARRTLVDGWWFDSKVEAARYEELKLLRRAGEVLWFICQPQFRLPGKIVYVADFLVVRASGVTVEDVKGIVTRVSLNKIKQVEELYGIKVEIIRKERAK